METLEDQERWWETSYSNAAKRAGQTPTATFAWCGLYTPFEPIDTSIVALAEHHGYPTLRVHSDHMTHATNTPAGHFIASYAANRSALNKHLKLAKLCQAWRFTAPLTVLIGMIALRGAYSGLAIAAIILLVTTGLLLWCDYINQRAIIRYCTQQATWQAGADAAQDYIDRDLCYHGRPLENLVRGQLVSPRARYKETQRIITGIAPY